MNKIIALVGMTGAGKTFVADELVKKGFSFLRFGQITLDIVKERNLEPTEENEKKIREDFRKEHGMGAYAILNIPKFNKLLETSNVVGDGLYSWSEYKILKEEYKERLIVIAIFSPPNTRYERLANRILVKEDKDLRNRPANINQAKSRDYAEIENIEKGGPIAMADYTIININSKEDVLNQLNKIINQID
ncbi:AAA family ATPase [Candidatus Woesearchaeota archaeon]|nr:AAA family ATPase [Candidatus Woesearchaeota archaeon]MCF7901196.1 AAA family ATPase [Candidatus Woesearchaeota archaeon]MCF8013709.1 AAA family ATPase [Candidatus Woesearchaeota archaeon]